MKITVDKESPVPLYWQISDQLKNMILNGALIDGTILPSERVLAEQTGVHRNTVIKAYGELKDEALIDAVQGVGYRVTCASTARDDMHMGGHVNWQTIIKDEYQDMECTFDDFFLHFAEEHAISFSTGMPPAVYDEKMVAEDMAEILANENRKPFYLTPYQGDLLLRHRMISYLRTKGIRANLGQVQVLSETNQALDFIVTTLLKPGDTVILEEPVSPDVFRVIELAGGNCITVPVDEDGIVCTQLGSLIERHRPKFIYVNSSFHDPTGNLLSIERRKALLDLSEQYRIPIIEEDAASELAFDRDYVPTIKSMDRCENVIYIYSFSLTFIPGLSMAFVVAPEKLIKSLSYLVSIRIMSLDWMTQKLLAKYMDNGTYTTHMKQICDLNQQKCELMCRHLDRLKSIGVTYSKPKGGVYVWVSLPSYMDSRQIARQCERTGVAMIPGTIFYPKKNKGQNQLRLNYSFESFTRIEEGMEKVVQVIMSAAKNV